MPLRRKSAGFTLIELSIVLVIIGLLSAGVLFGRDLIRAAELRSVTADIERFNAAVMTFRSKYACLPGDCPNATDYFEQDAGDCALGTVAIGTCNGDGDKKIGFFCSTFECTDQDKDGREKFLAWQQLSLANMIDGVYSGTSEASAGTNYGFNRASMVGWNVPASRIDGAGYLISDMRVTTYAGDRFPVSGHYIFFGNPLTDWYALNPPSAGQLYEPSGPAVSPIDAASIDGKIDDGKPDTGVVMSVYNAASYINDPLVCVIERLPGVFAYASREEVACALLFKASF
jgi:prepilin-type N-terminal cleavage/methylation domain-containing protein